MALVVVVVGYLLWPDIAYAAFCTPIIRRFIPNTSVKSNAPSSGYAKTVNDTANDNAPTPTRKPLDHFEIYLSLRPWMILAIPMKSNPRARRATSTSIAKIGNAKTVIPNRTTNAPRPIFPNFDDLFDCVKPVITLSIPTTSRLAERMSASVATPNPGFKITASDNAMTIPPRTSCNILVPLGEFVCSAFTFIHVQINATSLIDVLKGITATALYRPFILLFTITFL